MFNGSHCTALGSSPVTVHFWLDQLIHELQGQGITCGIHQGRIMRRLLSLGVRLHLSKAPEAIGADRVSLGCIWTGEVSDLPADAVVMVTSRLPEDGLYRALKARAAEWDGAGIAAVRLIGDAAAPGPIAWATYAGRRFAEEIDTEDHRGDVPSFRREIAGLEPGPSRLPPPEGA